MLINPGDVADGVLVNALWAVGQMIMRPPGSRRVASDLDVAGWLDTEALTRNELHGVKLELPELPEADIAGLEAALKHDEVQGALQALLAARLTGAPETDAARAREAVQLALRGTEYAEQLSDYYDRKIGDFVGNLQGRLGFAKLRQVRNEAYNSRIVALLGAIERQVAVLADPGRGSLAETEFLALYRRQVHTRHGKLEPPDFERRRRVPVEKIYVTTSIYAHDAERVNFRLPPVSKSSFNVTDLIARLDRTVLLGDPGGGKTTAANVLANYFASDPAHKVPFIVTLREYAAKEPLEFSIVSHIEQTLQTLYQSAAPDGLVERLLLTGRALVIFDGLDELLDTSRRREVSDRVEQFCSAYPLTRVLVTSRVIGYDQAQLDVEQFTCYRLGGFGENEVAEYARKWFTVQENMSPAEAETESLAFLTESTGAADLRYNPLMLSLMCILYRGAGSLPRDRAGVYSRCAELLLGKWDESRRIHHELQAGHLVEPAIRYLAWWLFNSKDFKGAVTERALVDETAKFLHGRGFESAEEARAAASEFVEFCGGRMWVLSETGTTADGEKLYAFTHRTFLEYFAAAHLATVSDTPEDLAYALVPYVSSFKGWNLVGELAIQIKDRGSDRGADRIYAIFLNLASAHEDRGSLLKFLAECLESARPSPSTIRSLVRAMLNYRFTESEPLVTSHPLRELLSRSGNFEQLIGDEMNNRIAAMVMSDDKATRVEGLVLALEIGQSDASTFWSQWSAERANSYAAEIIDEAIRSSQLRIAALESHVISLEQALGMPDGLGALMETYPKLLSMSSPDPYLISLYNRLLPRPRELTPRPRELTSRPRKLTPRPRANEDVIRNFALIGRYLASNPGLPWARIMAPQHKATSIPYPGKISGLLFYNFSGLGAAAVYAMYTEIWGEANRRSPLFNLSMPAEFKKPFRDWSEGRVNFVEILRK